MKAHGPALACADPDDPVNEEVDIDASTPLNDRPLPAGRSSI